MKNYKIGDKSKVYEIINNGTFKENHTGKQVAAIEDLGLIITVPLKSRYSEDAHPYENLKYWIADGERFDKEAKHVCTMRITKIKK